ncbi:hypothetical protein MuYL_3104 [Mucilaginibacter xinganensis]|uniref:Uncharacterized protein n=1 Tax=Mucilaginibacter xinganensis TaxID=1234841 RepID=A0A223NYN4_9SPHI|nr:hypothetical protein MuYL_3104 [Mucilaginibacter xinganensis]
MFKHLISLSILQLSYNAKSNTSKPVLLQLSFVKTAFYNIITIT